MHTDQLATIGESLFGRITLSSPTILFACKARTVDPDFRQAIVYIVVSVSTVYIIRHSSGLQKPVLKSDG